VLRVVRAQPLALGVANDALRIRWGRRFLSVPTGRATLQNALMKQKLQTEPSGSPTSV
jgi:hypothetical protein